MDFVGRTKDLQALEAAMADVTASGSGRMLSVRGRRQVGKSRLITEFVERRTEPYVYFTAIKKATPNQQLTALREEVHASSRPLENASQLFTSPPADWSDALTKLRLAAALTGRPVIVVLDEIPWAVDSDETLEGRLQNAWDRELERLPVLLILVGSDIGMMERLTAHDRPLYGRAKEMVVRPFHPAECRSALGSGTTALDALDAHLVTGGYPRLIDDLRRAGDLSRFVRNGLSDENSSLVVTGGRSLDAEFPVEVQARRVLRAIGSDPVGKATFSNAVAKLGPADAVAIKTAVTRGVEVLSEKGAVTVDTPFGAGTKSRITRYRVVDPYLSFWLRFIEPHVADIARGRHDLAVKAFTASWTTWRGVAIEPLVRESVFRLGSTHPQLEHVEDVGGWWNRENNPEIDVVAGKLPKRVDVMGTVKWRNRKPVSAAELRELADARSVVPNAGSAKLLTVSIAGLAKGVQSDLHLGPDELITAW